jgi:2-iminobutanoate/2-iminopropanoate deaminase
MMISPRLLRATLVPLVLGAASGCTSGPTKAGVPWWPQGPGDVAQRAPADPASGKADTGSAPARPGTAAPAAGGPAAEGGYTQATRYGDLLFVSGQIAVDPATGAFDAGSSVADQTRVVMRRIQAILDSHRHTLANVVYVTVYLSSINDLTAMNGVYETFFKGALPARAVVEVAKLPRGARVEIAVISGR